jgi:hypothetical protein
MTTTQIRIAIAEYRGMQNDTNCDLSVMHELEKTLTSTQRDTYLDWLDVACGNELELSAMLDGSDLLFALINATAEQRAEAFLKTMGLYDECIFGTGVMIEEGKPEGYGRG